MITIQQLQDTEPGTHYVTVRNQVWLKVTPEAWIYHTPFNEGNPPELITQHRIINSGNYYGMIVPEDTNNAIVHQIKREIKRFMIIRGLSIDAPRRNKRTLRLQVI